MSKHDETLSVIAQSLVELVEAVRENTQAVRELRTEARGDLSDFTPEALEGWTTPRSKRPRALAG